MNKNFTRRQFVTTAAIGAASAATHLPAQDAGSLPLIDIHQHPGFKGRNDARVFAHQRAMGAKVSFILPAGIPADLPSTDGGKRNGLAAGCAPVEAAFELVQKHPKALRFFANEPPDHPDAKKRLEKYLKLGAIGIGEQKFKLPIDSKPMLQMYDIAKEFDVPVLMHFQHDTYNLGIERFHKILDRYPSVNFIGHAQTFWGNIDLKHEQKSMYPKGKVTPGGITDRLLADHQNMYGDHSAGSGLNALMRDEEHGIGFLERHQDKLMFGSDCYDVLGRGPSCRGAVLKKGLARLASSQKILRKILFENASRLFQLNA
ncbi:MAG: amidohydrolase [Verrucomicrobiales bacterium]|nr:amidohydrolase [Verrucomicrobiales bacterium]